MSEQDSDMNNSLESAAMNRGEVRRMRGTLSFQNRKSGYEAIRKVGGQLESNCVVKTS